MRQAIAPRLAISKVSNIKRNSQRSGSSRNNSSSLRSSRESRRLKVARRRVVQAVGANGEQPKGQQTPALPAGQFHTSTSAGVGFQPLQGLLSCGQLEISTMALHSARSSTYFPAAGCHPRRSDPLRRHRHVHKEVNVGADIAFMQTAIVQTGAEKIVPAAVRKRLSRA